jgi:hypothetical protein
MVFANGIDGRNGQRFLASSSLFFFPCVSLPPTLPPPKQARGSVSETGSR